MLLLFTVIIIGYTTLRVLNVGWNKVGDDGMLMISEELQHNNSLTELSVQNCGLSVKGEKLQYNGYLHYCYDHYRCCCCE